MENLKKYKILLIILFVAAFLRLWQLGSIPPHLTSDEAALGYNAYSILKTYRDEYGELFPIIFKSFGDYKPGLYVYLTVPFVALFGLNEYSVRLPSAISGVVSVYLISLIVHKLFKNKKLDIIAPALLAVNPWYVHFSRGAWEVNVALTLTLLGIYFFLKSFKRPKFLLFSSIFLSLTLLTYQGAKLSSSLILLILVLIYWKKLFALKKETLVISVVIGLVISLPIITSLFLGKTGRLTVFSVFSYPRPEDYLQEFLDQGKEKIGSISYYLFHPEALNFTRGILGRWFNHFSGRFLFFEGDWQNPMHSAPNHGVLLFTDLFLLPVGFFTLLSKKISKEKLLILLWLVLSPLPAVLSRDQVQAVRAFNLLVPLMIISAFGLAQILTYIQKVKTPFLQTASYFLLVIGFSLAIVYYLDAYFIHLPKHDSKYWKYGYEQVVEAVTPIQKNYQSIKVQQSFAQPYIYFLFFQKYDPAKYQKQANLVESEYQGDVGYVTRLDNIEFVPIDWSVNRGDNGSLIVGDPIRIPTEDSGDENLFKLIDEIKYPDGNIAFKIIEVM